MNLHLMRLLEISHFSKQGELLFNKKNIDNILHLQGEEFILRVLFSGLSLPFEYYLGLDSRTTLLTTNNLSSLSGFEPNGNGYTRQNVESSAFSILTDETGNYQANSPVVLFRATTNYWGPVRNMFIATQGGYSGYLISSVSLGTDLTVQAGEIISIRIGLGLRNS